MNKIKLTYGQLMEAFNPNFELDKEFAIPEGVYVENGTASLIPVQQAIVKSPTEMLEVEFATGYKMIVSEEHMFRYHGVAVSAKEAEIVDTSFGDLKVVSKTPVGERLAYDIQVPAPHWYVNDENCIYSHNTNMAVMMAKGYMDTNKDYDPEDSSKQPILVVFDSEFAIKPTLKSFNIPEEQTVYIPFENLEELKETLTQLIQEVQRGEKVFFLIDSISQVASIKEVADALKGDVKVDMTRAKEMNSLFRIITPMLAIRDLPLVAINSFYEDNANQYADPIIKGGKQNFLSSDIIWFVSRAQDKDDDGLKGWFFNYKALKHRFVKEKSIFKLHVTFDGGIDWASGLLELGVESKRVKQAGAWYELADDLKTPDLNKKFQKKQIMIKGSTGFLETLLACPQFNQFCEDKYRLENGEMIAENLEAE